MHETKYFGLSVFFLLFMHLLPFISLGNQEFTVNGLVATGPAEIKSMMMVRTNNLFVIMS
jgi:hypothetical protein